MASRSDLWPVGTTGSTRYIYHALPQCPALSGGRGELHGRGRERVAARLDTEAESHLKQRGCCLQPQRKCVHLVISLTRDSRPLLPPFVLHGGSGGFCSAGYSVRQHSFQSDSRFIFQLKHKLLNK